MFTDSVKRKLLAKLILRERLIWWHDRRFENCKPVLYPKSERGWQVKDHFKFPGYRSWKEAYEILLSTVDVDELPN